VDTPLLEMKNICMDFPGVRALNNVDLTVRSGEIHALVGENGAGKSTLIKVLAGAYRPTSGEILLDGKKSHIDDPRDALSRGIGVVYQDRALVPFLTAGANMLLGREPTGAFGAIDNGAIEEQARAIFEMMGVSVPLNIPVNKMRAGDQQLTEIAKIVQMKPRLMVLDEPTAALSDRETQALFDLMRRFRKQGMALIFISHHLEEIFEMADRVTVLRNGKVAASRPITEFTTDGIIRLMIDRELGSQYVKREIPIGPEVLRAENLSCKKLGVDDISITARAGEIVGLGGLMGAGRTELAMLLFGAAKADSGTVYVDGQDVTPRSVDEATRAGIYLVPEKRREYGLVHSESVTSNITLPFLKDFSRFSVVGIAKEVNTVNALIRNLQIKVQKPTDSVGTLSGGNQQKVVIAKWLTKRGRVFIFDEPTQGIDVGAKTEVYEMIMRIAQDGAAVILISSDLRELVAMSDRVYVLRNGQVAGEIGRENLTGENVLRYALGGA
jgi:ribose transport system ATP-binding protein